MYVQRAGWTVLVGCVHAVVRKRHFLRHFILKMIILPRQARDKHREDSTKEWRFPRNVPSGQVAPAPTPGWFSACRALHKRVLY
jgi:hypothetical protein